MAASFNSSVAPSPANLFSSKARSAHVSPDFFRARLRANHARKSHRHGADDAEPEIKRAIQERFEGHLILSGGYDSAEKADVDLSEGRATLIAVGRPFISNPDLVSRLESNGALKPVDSATFYTPGEAGYLDY